MINYNQITTRDDVDKFVATFISEFHEDMIMAFDTETTGLHLKQDVPFLYICGFNGKNKSHVYLLDMERYPDLTVPFLATVHRQAAKCKWYIGHNVKFDLHMLANIGMPYIEDNVLDTMITIRLAHDSLHVKEGGPPLQLKQYVKRYIDRRGGAEEKKLKAQQSSIAKEYNLKLKHRLSAFKTPEGKSWGLGYLTEFFKSPISTIDDFPNEELKLAYQDWYNKIPADIQDKMTGMLVSRDDIPYTYIDRELIIPYAMKDVVYVLKVFEKTMPVIKTRKQTKGLRIEQKLIKPLFEMERVGFDIDIDYLKRSEKNVKEYIIQQHNQFNSLVNEELSVGQHKRIKEILNNKYNLNVTTTNDGTLSKVLSDLEEGHPAIRFIELLQELRTLYKWYSTYIVRFLNELKLSPRLYTQINQVGTVSGRVTSDFQQFPKYAIKREDGTELFHPRKMVVASEEHPIVYLDYSQIELRLQAMYTILVGHPDLNLCRAYMPYKCYKKTNSGKIIPFDYTDPSHVDDWDGEWYHEEDHKHWDPVDVHGATAKVAFGVTEDHPNFKKFRSMGKTVNFAKNYGAQYSRVAQMFPDKSPAEVRRIDEAYYIAFPGVKMYHEYCNRIAMSQGYATNLFGVRYYGASGHKLKNMLIQGSGAYFLKIKIREIYDYNKEHDIKTKFQMNIHDELSFILDSPDTDIYLKYKEIMEDFPGTYVPIVADVEMTTTNWGEKYDIEV